MFETDIKRVAVQLAILLFFVMAIVGWFSGLTPETIASRSIGGAVAIYLLVRFAGTLVARVIMRALVNEQMRRHQQTEQGS